VNCVILLFHSRYASLVFAPNGEEDFDNLIPVPLNLLRGIRADVMLKILIIKHNTYISKVLLRLPILISARVVRGIFLTPRRH
jgi:hypothetical protein